MPIIKKQTASEKVKIKIDINKDLLEQIHSYMTFAEIEDVGHFFSESASFVLTKDKEWSQFQKELKRGKKK